MSSDDASFLTDEPLGNEAPPPTPWKLLVVDDEAEVHLITRMVLQDYRFEGRSLEILEARSSAEAREILLVHPDVAVILLDVVMETDQAGLELVKWIRQDLGNALVRIILRTGQPGAAPEKQVILEYEINDYKAKTELTSIKLFTAVTAAIRAWRDLRIIRRSKEGFQKIVQASGHLFANRSVGPFIEGVLTQLTSLLYFEDESLYIRSEGLAIRQTATEHRIVAGTGSYRPLTGASIDEIPDPELRALVTEVIRQRSTQFSAHYYLGFFPHEDGQDHILVLKTSEAIKPVDQEIISLFSANVSVALENVNLNQRIETTQKEIIFTLGEVIETQSQETGQHVRRVAAYNYHLARAAGFTEGRAQMLKLASPLHDVGKIGVSDTILTKPGPLTPTEMTQMRQHTLVGYEILRYGGSGILQTAALIALTHHERWDGGGYPQGLAGEDIPIEGRITAITDVFDALSHRRSYKEAWTLDDAWGYLEEHAGSLFDPDLVRRFVAIRPQIEEILKAFPD